jgi:nucleoside-diphosphate-sugar epimerase
MKVLVTGAAGFIGSHLCEWLLAQGDDVHGVDAMTDYYDPWRKEQNIRPLLDWDRFVFTQADLLDAPLDTFLEGIDVVYHLAGQPGVRPSWGEEFAVYVERNVLATQRLLEAVRQVPIWKLVYASSSSVYGNAETLPTGEHLRPQPVSPYGVTKLAAEHLCELYRENFGVPTVSLRFFTVYGPRQRPDKAFKRLVEAAVSGKSFLLYGDGEQTRDFTYVDDIVHALRLAALSPWYGVANLGGGSRVSMNDVIALVSSLAMPVDLVRLPTAKGDVRHTAADTTTARTAFGYQPCTSVAEGLAAMVAAERAMAEMATP